MGHFGSTVASAGVSGTVPPPGYTRLSGTVPVVYPPRLANLGREVRNYLKRGTTALSEMLDANAPELSALVVADEDWRDAPRENSRPYPPGLPYFTRSVDPPALVLPETLSPAIKPRTGVTLPLTIWHELAHAFLLQREVVRTPAWLGEFVPQAAAAGVARRLGLPLEEHLSLVDREPGFTIRRIAVRATVEDQMAFQNLLLALGVAAIAEFGESFLKKLFHALWEETDVVNDVRAEELLAGALGAGGREWLQDRPEF